MADRIASGEIHIEVNDREAMSSLRAIDAEYERTMDDIDRQKATVTIDADLRRLKKGLKEADAAVNEAMRRREAATTASERRSTAASLREARKRQAALAAETAAAMKRVEARKDENVQLALTEKRLAAIAKREQARERVLAKAERDAERRAQAEERRILREQRLQDQAAAKIERIRLKEERDSERAAAAREKEIAQIPKMQRRYMELSMSLERLAASRRKARGNQRAQMVVDLRMREAEADMAALKQRLERIGSPIDVDVNIHPGRELGTRIRHISRDRGVMAGAGALGTAMGIEAGRRFARTFNPANIASAGMRGLSRLGSLLGNLSEMTVRVGPFTATIRQFALAMSLFAPIILDTVGALGSFVSVLGGATAGLGALSLAVIGGGIPALIGMGTVIAGVVGDFKNIMTASKAYDKAVRDYGEGSEQAAKKLEVMRSNLGSVSEETVNAFKRAGKLSDQWNKLTEPGRAAAFNTIAQGIKTWEANMGMFARRTNEGMGVLQRGLTGWMQALRSMEGQRIVDTMFGNFNAALAPFLTGLGSLLGYFGRVGAAASHTLPQIMRNFRDWAAELNNTGRNAMDLRNRVQGVIGTLRSFGRFVMATSRFLKEFFGGGIEAGERFTDTMSNAMNRWTAFLQTADGNRKLMNFFDEAVSGAQSLYATLAPVIASFVRWGSAIAPFARAFLDGAAAVASFTAQVLKLTGLTGPITALATTIGAIWAVGRISAATRAVAGFTGAMLGLRTAAAGTAAATGASGIVGSLLGRGGAEATARKAGIVRTALTGLGIGATGVGLASAAATVGVAALAGGVAYLGYKLITGKDESERFENQIRNQTEALDTARNSQDIVNGRLTRAIDRNKSARSAIERHTAALKDLKKGTQEYREQELLLWDAQQRRKQAAEDRTREAKTNIQNAKEEFDAANDLRVSTDQRLQQVRREIAEGEEWGMMASKKAALLALERRLVAQAEADHRRLIRAMNAEAAAALNLNRARKNMDPVKGRNAQRLGALQRRAPTVAQKVAMTYETPRNVGAVSQAANRALRSGVKVKTVLQIVADSKNAEQALRRINRADVKAKMLKFGISGADGVLSTLDKVDRKAIKEKIAKIIESGGNPTIERIQKIIRMQIRDKKFRVDMSNPGVAAAQVELIRAGLSRIQSKRILVDVVRREREMPRGKARGGLVTAARGRTDTMIDDALDRHMEGRLSRAPGKGSARVTRPTFMRRANTDLITGEERSTEFVIATNPQHRKSNLHYLSQAASALGVQMAARGLPGRMGLAGKFGGEGNAKAEFNPNAVIRRKAKFGKKGKSKTKKPFTTKRGWGQYVESLQDQQGYWEREVSIRESEVREPEDMVIVTGQSEVVDPVTKEVTKVDQYGPNPKIGSEYIPDLAKVKEAMNTLLDIIRELVRAIPHSLRAATTEQKYHKSAMSSLQAEIKKENKKKEPDQKRLNKLQNRRDRHETTYRQLKDDRKRLADDRVDAGFDFREAAIDRNNLTREMNDVMPKAEAEAVRENAPTGGAGSGTSDPGGLQYGSEPTGYATADAEARNALQSFGENFLTGSNSSVSQVGASSGTASGRGGAGNMQTLLSALSGGQSSDLTAVASAASAAFGGGRGAASAMSSRSSGGMVNVTSVEGGQSSGGGDKIVNFYQTFNQQQDPHTFVKGVEFEVNTAL